MTDRTSIDRRRATEDRALELGAERAELRRRLRENTTAITALCGTAVELGITVQHFARLVGVRRQSLYRWREGTRDNHEETTP